MHITCQRARFASCKFCALEKTNAKREAIKTEMTRAFNARHEIQALKAFTRADRREILRAIVFLWNTPFETARCISGCASLRAADAACLSPEAIASSTLRRNVLTRERRALFTAVRRAILRTIFLAEDVLAILLHSVRSAARLAAGARVYSHRSSPRQHAIFLYFSADFSAGSENRKRSTGQTGQCGRLGRRRIGNPHPHGHIRRSDAESNQAPHLQWQSPEE
jgi:hypothetical protein